MLGGGAAKEFCPQRCGASCDGPDCPGLELFRLLDRAPSVFIDEVSHVGVDRTKLENENFIVWMFPHQFANKTLVAEIWRVVEVDDQSITEAGNQNGILVLVV